MRAACKVVKSTDFDVRCQTGLESNPSSAPSKLCDTEHVPTHLWASGTVVKLNETIHLKDVALFLVHNRPSIVIAVAIIVNHYFGL